MNHGPNISPTEALSRLKEGNRRFCTNALSRSQRTDEARRRELTGGQAPYAAILTCADSRISPSHIFDGALGELFVCRNAGNLIDEGTLGSIEYAAAYTGCPLLCVMGHNTCGAVGAAVAAVEDLSARTTDNLDEIVRRLLPPVLATRGVSEDNCVWTDEAAKKNVEMVCKQVRQRSPLLNDMIAKGDFKVVGGFYDLGSGQVEFILD